MPDREKVIKGLEWVIVLFSNYERHAMDDEEMQSLNDAIVLLKAQEPVEPILALNDGEHKLWQCGNCKVAVFTRDTKYCHNCGRAVKWDE